MSLTLEWNPKVENDETKNNCRALVREALNSLSLEKEEQIRINGPGCVACDLVEDFNHAHFICEKILALELSTDQKKIMQDIKFAMDSMISEDYKCFSPDVLERPIWCNLRVLARNALDIFEWSVVKGVEFVETKPGVWHRPPLNSN